MENVTKRFGKVVANNAINLELHEGEILSLLGENGSGKTTLMNMLSGIYFPDEGQIYIHGEPVTIASPKDAFEHGIGMIHQHFKLVDLFTATENIILGLEGKLDIAEASKKVKEICDKYGFDIDPNQKIYDMSVSQKQTVEIVKVLYRGADILILDEPTAVLTPQETDKLFAIMRNMKADGKSLIIITHKLHEVLDVSDRVAVLRKGEYVGDVATKDADQQSLTDMMVGHTVSLNISRPEPKDVEKRLVIEGLTAYDELGVKRLDDVSFTINAGEVLGIAGLVGAGRTEIMRGLFGVDYITSCDVYVHGQKVRIPTPAAAKKHGIAFLTEDRKIEGLTLDFTIKANMSMANLPKLRRGLLTSAKVENEIADQYIKLINVKTPSRNQKVGNLSGGNQQKVVIGKWLNADPEILIMDEPTRGIDVGAKWEIYGIINELAAQGKAVILISSELPEVLGMSDRVLVVKDDAIVAELTGDKINAVEVMRYAL